MNIHTKVLYKILAKSVQQNIKRYKRPLYNKMPSEFNIRKLLCSFKINIIP